MSTSTTAPDTSPAVVLVQQPRTPREPATRRTTTVPGRPALAGVANAAGTLAEVTYHLGGWPGVIGAAAGTVALGGAGLVARKGAGRRRTARASGGVRVARSSGRAAGLPRLGGGTRTARPATSAPSRSSRSSGALGRLLRGAGPAGTGRTAAGRSSTGRTGSGQGRRVGLFGRAGSGRTAGTGIRAGRTARSSTLGGALRRAGQAARRSGAGLARVGRATRAGVAGGVKPRQAAALARRASQQGRRPATWRGRLGRAVAGWTAAGLAGLAAGTRNVARRLRKKPVPTPQQVAKPKPPATGVRRPPNPNPTARTQRVPVPAARPAPVPRTGGAMFGIDTLADEILAAATRYEPTNMHQYGQDLAKMPDAMRKIARALSIITTKSQDAWPVDSAVNDLIAEGSRTLNTLADALEEVPATFRRVHRGELERFEHPRRGEEKWDVRQL